MLEGQFNKFGQNVQKFIIPTNKIGQCIFQNIKKNQQYKELHMINATLNMIFQKLKYLKMQKRRTIIKNHKIRMKKHKIKNRINRFHKNLILVKIWYNLNNYIL